MAEHHQRIQKIHALIRKAFREDRYRFQKELRTILRKIDKTPELSENLLTPVEQQVQESVKKRRIRLQSVPQITYPEGLPITEKKADIINAVKRFQVVIISGETGSGKTTQIPKFCLAAGRGIDGVIGCTQPRRIAAVTVAQRIAEELGEDVGKSVGYKIRFTDRTHSNSYIKIMTDGILLAEAQNDPRLNSYDVIIVDEAHERSLNIDFVLGILKTLLKKRKDLKLIITSATLDTEKFSNAFDQAPIIEVSGRMYPVEVRYVNPDADPSLEEATYVETAVRAIDDIMQESPYGGDILTFMPTEQDIRETCELLEGRTYPGSVVMPLFARLSASEQIRVFSKVEARKLIIATNIAETSVTIPGIQYVVDTGLARIRQYVPRTRTTALPVLPISKSSADQRKGRCGRVRNGVCIRLYSEDDYESRPAFTPPEILRSNLAEVILRMISLRLGNASEFPFIDKPADKSIRDGYDMLLELGAIRVNPQSESLDNRYSLTENGSLMAQMPIDPRLSRMILQAKSEGCMTEILILASALSIQDPRERPADKESEADAVHAQFKDPQSDFLTFLNIWSAYQQVLSEKSTGKLKRFCKDRYLSFRRMREWRDVHGQLTEILKEIGYIESDSGIPAHPISDAKYAAIHRSILTGFLSNIAVKKEKNIFKAAKDREVMIFPGSGLFQKPGEWIVAAEIVETSRLFARTAATIQPGWLEELGKDLCRYSYSNPHWERKRGEVAAYEQASLFGLVIVSERPVSYGRINPDDACRIFIRSALIEEDIGSASKTSFAFLSHNRKLLQQVEDMENRLRRRDIRVTDDELFEFYYERLSGVYDIRTLQHRIRRQGNDHFLRMKLDDLMRYSPDPEELKQFPDVVRTGSHDLRCTYHFNPGTDDDGVTVTIPAGSVQSIASKHLDWGVPGLLKEKIIALIKSLPKEYRRKLVPAASYAETIEKEMPKEDIPLISALGNFIHQRFGIDIPASAWAPDAVPNHLKMRLSVVGPDGKVLYSGRDKLIPPLNFSDSIPYSEFEAAKQTWERSGILEWNFGDLPDVIVLDGKNGTRWEIYPGLTPDGNAVSIRLFQKKSEAEQCHPLGVRRLYEIHFSNELKFLKRNLVLYGEQKDYAAFFGGVKKLEARLYESVISDLFKKAIRTQKEFHAYAVEIAPLILKKGVEKISSIAEILKPCHEADTVLRDLEISNRFHPDAVRFIHNLRQDMKTLVPENFIDVYPPDRLTHISRYVKAIIIRAQRGLVNLDKDQSRAKEVDEYSKKLNELLSSSNSVSKEKKTAIDEFSQMIEEYKVSIFAQELKTAFPVSPKRLKEKLKEIERMI